MGLLNTSAAGVKRGLGAFAALCFTLATVLLVAPVAQATEGANLFSPECETVKVSPYVEDGYGDDITVFVTVDGQSQQQSGADDTTYTFVFTGVTPGEQTAQITFTWGGSASNADGIPVHPETVTVAACDQPPANQLEATNFAVTQGDCVEGARRIDYRFDYTGGPDGYAIERNPLGEEAPVATGEAPQESGTVSGSAGNQPAGTHEYALYGSRGGQPIATDTVTLEACPQTPPPPVDTDGDGVTDDVDQCDDQPGPAGNGGCPLPEEPTDSDGDGVTDDKDQCAETPAGTEVDNKGCPVDDGNGPPGNNGTLKVHEEGTPSGTESNDPKVCVFNFEGFGFDEGQTGYLMFEPQGGSQPQGESAGPFEVGPADEDGYFASPYFNDEDGPAIKNGTYKVTLYGKRLPSGELADEKAKSKVFKVECEEVPPPPPPTDACPNIPGDQSEVPPGTVVDEDGNCVEMPPPAVLKPEAAILDNGCVVLEGAKSGDYFVDFVLDNGESTEPFTWELVAIVDGEVFIDHVTLEAGQTEAYQAIFSYPEAREVTFRIQDGGGNFVFDEVSFSTEDCVDKAQPPVTPEEPEKPKPPVYTPEKPSAPKPVVKTPVTVAVQQPLVPAKGGFVTPRQVKTGDDGRPYVPFAALAAGLGLMALTLRSRIGRTTSA